MTKNRTVISVTVEYMQQHGKIKSADEIVKIEEEILAEVNEKFDEHNAVCSKDEKWKKQDALNFAQIAIILSHGFDVAKINFCEKMNIDDESKQLALYVNEAVADILDIHDRIGIYELSEIYIKQLANRFNDCLTSHEIDEVIESLKRSLHVTVRKRCDNKDLIAVENGIFNYATKTLEPFNENMVFLSKSPISYNPNATNIRIHNSTDNTDWDVESWMESLSDDPEIVNLLWEITGATIRPNVRWNKSAWLFSEQGNNGKGTLCEMMRLLCGESSCTSITLSDFSKDFALEPLLKSSAIIVDENDVGSFIDKAGNLKSVITNDVIQINRKFKIPVSFQFRGFMVQCLNEYPRIKDKSDSFYRRQLFIPMTKCFTGVERPYIKNDYLHRQEVLEYILYRVLNMNYYALSEPESCRQALNEYKEVNDPVRAFWANIREEFVWDLLPFTFLYDLYKSWFKKNVPSGTVQSNKSFISDLQNIVRNDDIWYYEEKQIRVTKTNMSKSEPLIVEYGLDDWKSSRYKGTDMTKICEFDRAKAHYRGLQRYVQYSSEE